LETEKSYYMLNLVDKASKEPEDCHVWSKFPYAEHQVM